jgi:hypothetical protein
MKTCSKCKKSKSIENFYADKRFDDKHYPSCKLCVGDKQRNSYLKKNYGLDTNGYEKLLNIQQGGCAICGKKSDTYLPQCKKNKKLAVDHDHETGKIRGILCENCNRGIGLLSHSIELLKNAMDYINNNK